MNGSGPEPARDFEKLPAESNAQHWLVSWHPPSSDPAGRAHGAAGICITPAGDVVLVSQDGSA